MEEFLPQPSYEEAQPRTFDRRICVQPQLLELSLWPNAP